MDPITAVITCSSPLAHGAFGESAGNASLIRRMTLVSHPDRPRVPVVSGNALRGVLRRLVMRPLLARAGLSRQTLGAPQWDRLYAALANGGHYHGAGEDTVRPEEVRAWRQGIPPLSVFGSALYTRGLSGHLSVGFCWPRCRETIEAGVVTTGADIDAEDLVDELTHCRHVEREEHDTTLSGVTPMPTTTEVILPGTVLESEIRLRGNATTLERSCIAWGLDRIEALGGKSGAGLGRVTVEHDGDATEYAAWLERADLETPLRALAADLAKGKRGKR